MLSLTAFCRSWAINDGGSTDSSAPPSGVITTSWSLTTHPYIVSFGFSETTAPIVRSPIIGFPGCFWYFCRILVLLHLQWNSGSDTLHYPLSHTCSMQHVCPLLYFCHRFSTQLWLISILISKCFVLLAYPSLSCSGYRPVKTIRAWENFATASWSNSQKAPLIFSWPHFNFSWAPSGSSLEMSSDSRR